jgi:hypothetical protein
MRGGKWYKNTYTIRLVATDIVMSHILFTMSTVFRITHSKLSLAVSIFDKFMFVQSGSGDQQTNIGKAEFLFVPKIYIL